MWMKSVPLALARIAQTCPQQDSISPKRGNGVLTPIIAELENLRTVIIHQSVTAIASFKYFKIWTSFAGGEVSAVRAYLYPSPATTEV